MPVTQSFFITTTPRTGSSLLSEALEFTRIAGTPREYFEPAYEQDWSLRLAITSEDDYFDRILAAGMTANGVFGAKVHWHQFVHLRSKLRAAHGTSLSELELLRRTFPELKYIFLTRRDKIAQAVSYYKAERTDVWHVVRPDAIGTRTMATDRATFDVDRIDHWVTRFAEDEASWLRYFETLGIEPFQVVYEDFLEAYESTLLAILGYLKIAIPAELRIVPPRLRKLADEVSNEWVKRFRELKRPSHVFSGPVNQSYFINTTPRTGGFLLAEALQSTRIAGRPREYFDPLIEKNWFLSHAQASDTQYLESVMADGTTSNGVFGAKVLWHQFALFTAQPRRIDGRTVSGAELLRRAFPDLRYVFLTRRDKTRQAVSYDRAIRTGVWWSIRSATTGNGNSPTPTAETPSFEFERIDEWVTRLSQFETSWRRHFQREGVEPFEIAYEDLVQDYEATVLAVLGYLGLPISTDLKIAPPRLEKQADLVTEEWVERYRRLKGR
jgi:trehalose 2-sulfotransferase